MKLKRFTKLSDFQIQIRQDNVAFVEDDIGVWVRKDDVKNADDYDMYYAVTNMEGKKTVSVRMRKAIEKNERAIGNWLKYNDSMIPKNNKIKEQEEQEEELNYINFLEI